MTSYEMNIGLEVHVELKTKTKIFCSCPTDFGAPPNTHCCPICLGYPGMLPSLNRRVVEYAVKAGLATNCKIAKQSKMDRKNYFYPDLPKAYQISQNDKPLCYDGTLMIETGQTSKQIGITRIHIEEDAGKLIHRDGVGTLIDGNRAGVPLIEIVSKPDIASAEEAVAYLKKLRTLMLYIGVSDCKMQEGSMRCDINLSVRPTGETALGTRTEIKNLNSFAFVAKAITFETARQIAILEAGGQIQRETRRFNMASGKTESMRSKEDSDDYRFFPEPDLLPIAIEKSEIECLKAELPELPDSRKARYTREYALSAYDGEQLTATRQLADYFEAVTKLTDYPKIVANLLLNENLWTDDDEKPSLSVAHFAELATLLGEEKINSSTAKKLLDEIRLTDESPARLVEKRGLFILNDRGAIELMLRQAIAENPRGLSDYKNGKSYAIKPYIGAVMKASGGLANPSLINEILREITEHE